VEGFTSAGSCSRFEDAKIVEDWAASDTMQLTAGWGSGARYRCRQSITGCFASRPARAFGLRVTEDAAAYWTGVYARKDPEQVSWYEQEPTRSLSLIESTRLPRDAAILDVGGGASSLAAALAANGYTDVTVADISSTALDRARAQASSVADQITWIEADVRTHDFARSYDLWHDRAVFHFMVASHDRAAYLEVLRRTLRPAGHLILATFGPEGPRQCSGLPVARYDAPSLAALLGADFTQIWSGLQAHRTPSGTNQQFLYAHFVRSREPSATS
jgi:SAM-dependent methyltransferase